MASTPLRRCVSIMFVFCTSSILLFDAKAGRLSDVSMQARHEAWMAIHARVYKNDTEKEMRFKIFKANTEYIDATNALGRLYKLSINKFSDMTNEEFQSYYNRNKGQSSSIGSLSTKSYGSATASLNEEEIPASIDWRAKGAVNPVKNQGTCGSCWAFTAVAAIEGIIKISTGKLISLSEQQLIDCNNFNMGCEQGGHIKDAYRYMIDTNSGLTTEAIYPYNETQGTCNKNLSSFAAARIKDYRLVTPNNEHELMLTVANQPVAVAIDGSCVDFRHYSSGVLTLSCGTYIDHDVTLVGYGTTDDGTNFWIAKNSWGRDWGEEGYIRMQRDYDDKRGLCGLAMYPSFPLA